MHIPRRLVHVLIASLTAAALAGCDADPGTANRSPAPTASPSPSAADPVADLLAAADVMDRLGTADILLSGGMDGGGQQSWKSPQVTEIFAEPHGQRQLVRATADAMYLRVEDSTGKNWIKLDEKTAKALDAQTGTDHLAMISTFVAIANPVQDLRAAATDNTVTVLGPERVDGNNTIHYRAQVTLDSLIAQMTTLTDDARTTTRARLAAYAPAVTAEFWITYRDQLQQLSISAPASSPGKPAMVIGYMRSPNPAPTIPYTADAASST